VDARHKTGHDEHRNHLPHPVGNQHQHDHHGGEQPSALALFRLGEQGDGDEQADADQGVGVNVQPLPS
jgi:hypothetical protein